MTGEDKQISRCWGRLCKADIIMSLVSVNEAEDKWQRGAALLFFVSNICPDVCFSQGYSFFFFFAADMQFLTHSSAIG